MDALLTAAEVLAIEMDRRQEDKGPVDSVGDNAKRRRRSGRDRNAVLKVSGRRFHDPHLPPSCLPVTRRPSVFAQAAADVNRLRCNRSGRGRSQILDEPSHLVRGSVSAQWDACIERVQDLLRCRPALLREEFPNVLGKRRLHEARTDGIDSMPDLAPSPSQATSRTRRRHASTPSRRIRRRCPAYRGRGDVDHMTLACARASGPTFKTSFVIR